MLENLKLLMYCRLCQLKPKTESSARVGTFLVGMWEYFSETVIIIQSLNNLGKSVAKSEEICLPAIGDLELRRIE